MNALVNATSNQTMTSLEIAELCQKRHDSVKRTIEILSSKTDKRKAVIQLPHSVEVKNHLGQSVMHYVFSGEQGKLDSITVVAQLSPEFTAALVKRWHDLENQAIKPTIALPSDYIEALEHLLIAKKAEKLAIAERDYAIATKAQIGSKREATAMARASAESRRANSLEIQLDQARDYASVKKIEALTKRKFEWKPLKHWSVEHGIAIKKATDANYEKGVNTYSSSAWLAVYGVDIYALECAQ